MIKVLDLFLLLVYFIDLKSVNKGLQIEHVYKVLQQIWNKVEK